MTPRQRELVSFIEGYQARHGRSPTYWEMAGALSHRSLTWLRKQLDRFEARGVIRRTPGKRRSVRVAG